MYPRQSRYHFASYMAIMCPLMVLKGMVAAVVLDVLSVLTLVLYCRRCPSFPLRSGIPA